MNYNGTVYITDACISLRPEAGVGLQNIQKLLNSSICFITIWCQEKETAMDLGLLLLKK